jgi:methionyl-tRNA formyltransferase
MRVVFLGTPDFGAAILDAIVNSRHTVAAVVTQPDRINGRAHKLTPSPVKQYAAARGIPVLQYESVSRQGEADIRNFHPDIMVTAAFGQILKQNILDVCPVINAHASLLPAYRGASPVQCALLNGEKTVGVTIMKTELGVDTGDIIKNEGIELDGDENTEETLAKLAVLGKKLIVDALDGIERGKAVFVKQDESRATRCRMFVKEDGRIDFSQKAEQIKNFVRGMTPWPGAFASSVNGMLKIRKAEVCEGNGGIKCGEVVVSDPKNGIIVKCGEGYIKPLVVQGENGKAMAANEYLLGKKIPIGSILGD